MPVHICPISIGYLRASAHPLLDSHGSSRELCANERAGVRRVRDVRAWPARCTRSRPMATRIVVCAGHDGNLMHALECARHLAPLEHVLIVASPHSAAAVRTQLADYEGVELIIQLREQHTADWLVPLVQVVAHDPSSTVVFLPAELAVVDPQLLAETIREALADPDTISVIGPAPLMWRTGTRGCPLVAVGRAGTLWRLVRRCMQQHAALLDWYCAAIGTAEEGARRVAIYEQLPAMDFTEDVLAKARSIDIATVPSAAVRASAISS